MTLKENGLSNWTYDKVACRRMLYHVHRQTVDVLQGCIRQKVFGMYDLEDNLASVEREAGLNVCLEKECITMV